MAVKVTRLTRGLFEGAFLRQAAHREAEIAMLFDHPNIVPTYTCMRRKTFDGTFEQSLLQVGGSVWVRVGLGLKSIRSGA